MSEGVRRLAVVVRWVGYICAASVMLFCVAMGATGMEGWAVSLGVGLALSVMIAAASWAVGWIIEGFASR